MKNILDIEQQMYALELQKVKIEKQEKYNKLLQEQDLVIKRKCEQQLKRNNLVIEKFEELVSLGCGEYIELKRKFVGIWWYENKNGYGEKLLEKDYKSVDFQQTYIVLKKLPSKINVNSDGRLELPGNIYGRFQPILPKTAAVKIKDYFSEIEDDLKTAKNLSLNTKKLINQFQQKYPTSIIKSHIEEINTIYGRKTHRYNISIINIEFGNGNWVKLKVYNDGSWSIKEKHEAILKELTKEEIIDRLAPQ